MTNNFYESKIIEIKKLIKSNPKKAYKLLIEEMKMPYIPMKYEKIFLILKQKLSFVLNEKKIKYIPTQNILKMLYDSDENQDIAINLLSKINLHEHKFFLKKRIEEWKSNGKDKIRKSLLFEIMSEQNVDINLKIDNKKINPISDSIFNDKESIIAFNNIKKSSIKIPQIIDIALTQLNQYLLLKFPNKIKNGNALAKKLINISHYMIDPSFKINLKEKDLFNFLKLIF